MRWSGSWWFLACVVVLALNDHVLKARHAAWWTGKLSDLAGLAVVATALAVLLGRRAGLVAAAAGWMALKVGPGVAELAAPLLGGVTRRDPTDLVALAVLPALWPVLVPPPPDPLGRDVPAVRPPAPRRRAALAAVLPVLGACGAVLATTATSCGADPAVAAVVADGGDVWAQVHRSYAPADPADADWSVSHDAGRSWVEGEPPARVVAQGRARTGTGTGGTAEVAEPSCDEEACYRVVDRRRVERRAVGEDRWVVELALDDAERAAISTGCSDPQQGVLTSVVGAAGGARSTGDDGGAVASLGADGVAVRAADGRWSTVRVVDRPPDRLQQLLVVAGIGTALAVVGGVVLVVVLVRRARRREPGAPWGPSGGWSPPAGLPPPPDRS